MFFVFFGRAQAGYKLQYKIGTRLRLVHKKNQTLQTAPARMRTSQQYNLEQSSTDIKIVTILLEKTHGFMKPPDFHPSLNKRHQSLCLCVDVENIQGNE